MTNSPICFLPEVDTVKDGESVAITELNETFHAFQTTTAKDHNHAVRAVHAKAHGVMEGVLTVDTGIPAHAPPLPSLTAW